jgi:hypothetical protein
MIGKGVAMAILLIKAVCLFFALWFTAVLAGNLLYKNKITGFQFAVPAFFWALLWALSQWYL